MALKKKDWSILEKLGFDIKPIGVKYLVDPPEAMKKLEGKMPLCEMLQKAQQTGSFYIDSSHHACEAGAYVLGQKKIQQAFISGGFGAGLGAFKDFRAAARVYNYIPTISKGVLNYVAFAPIESSGDQEADLEAPDVAVLLADTRQTWILMRAVSYETGEKWTSHFSPVIGCAWLFAWPYIKGQINFIATGLGFGMRRRHLFPDGLHFVAIPFDRWASILRVLREMPWTPEPFKSDGLEYVKQLRYRLKLE